MKTFKELMKIDEAIPKSTMYGIVKGNNEKGKVVFKGSKKVALKKLRSNEFGPNTILINSPSAKVGDKWGKGRNESVEATRMSMEAPFVLDKEEVETDEASLGSMLGKKAKKLSSKKSHTGYELYHKDFSSAMQHAYKFAKSKGHVIDPKEIDDKVATGPKKPSSGKTNRYSLKAGRKKVEIQVANLDNKRYELNMYIEGLELGEMKFEAGKVYHQDTSDGKMYFKAVDQQKNKRWKGLVLDIGQKKPKNGSADEKLRFWKATSDKDIPKALKEEVETRNGPPQIRFMWKRDKRITESDKAKSLAALRTALAVAKYKKAGGKIEKQPPGIARGALKFRGKGGTTRDDDEENRINRGVMSWKKLRHGKKKK